MNSFRKKGSLVGALIGLILFGRIESSESAESTESSEITAPSGQRNEDAALNRNWAYLWHWLNDPENPYRDKLLKSADGSLVYKDDNGNLKLKRATDPGNDSTKLKNGKENPHFITADIIKEKGPAFFSAAYKEFCSDGNRKIEDTYCQPGTKYPQRREEWKRRTKLHLDSKMAKPLADNAKLEDKKKFVRYSNYHLLIHHECARNDSDPAGNFEKIIKDLELITSTAEGKRKNAAGERERKEFGDLAEKAKRSLKRYGRLPNSSSGEDLPADQKMEPVKTTEPSSLAAEEKQIPVPVESEKIESPVTVAAAEVSKSDPENSVGADPEPEQKGEKVVSVSNPYKKLTDEIKAGSFKLKTIPRGAPPEKKSEKFNGFDARGLESRGKTAAQFFRNDGASDVESPVNDSEWDTKTTGGGGVQATSDQGDLQEKKLTTDYLQNAFPKASEDKLGESGRTDDPEALTRAKIKQVLDEIEVRQKNGQNTVTLEAKLKMLKGELEILQRKRNNVVNKQKNMNNSSPASHPAFPPPLFPASVDPIKGLLKEGIEKRRNSDVDYSDSDDDD